MARLGLFSLLVLSCGVTVQAGGPCSPASCSGCCDAKGECLSGFQPESCGRDGRQCEPCGAGLSCLSGVCGLVGTSSTGGGAANSGGGASGGVSGAGETCQAPTLLTLAPIPGDSKLRATAMGSTVGALDDENTMLSSCAGPGPDQFFTVDVPANHRLTVKVITGGAWRAVVRLRLRTCSELDDACRIAAPGASTAEVSMTLGNAKRVIITVDGAQVDQAGPFELQVEAAPLPVDGGLPETYCQRLVSAQTRFFAGRSSCSAGDGGALAPEVMQPTCVTRLGFCSQQDLVAMNTFLGCYEAAMQCLPGDEDAALQSYGSCANGVVAAVNAGQLSGTCRDALCR